jgi:hypothetical protein
MAQVAAVDADMHQTLSRLVENYDYVAILKVL